jgi:hypothetical protein
VRSPSVRDFLRIQPFGQLPKDGAARQDRNMLGTPGRRCSRRARRWAACAVAAAATAAGVAPLAQAQDKPPDGSAPSSCRPSPKGDPKRPPAIAEVAARARAGLEIAPGAIAPRALAAGRPAEVSVRLGPDPLGIAALLRVAPGSFWGSAGASVSANAPGAEAWGGVRADGSARLWLTAPQPGPVTMRLHVPGRALQRALGLCPTAGWSIGSALRRQGAAPGSPVLEVEDLPVPVPHPGPEPVPTPGPEPSP